MYLYIKEISAYIIVPSVCYPQYASKHICGYVVCCKFFYLGTGATYCHEILHDGTNMSRTCLVRCWGCYPGGFAKSEILGL